jgi:hypothetical protein
VQGLGGSRGELRHADPPVDAVGRVVRHISNEEPWA